MKVKWLWSLVAVSGIGLVAVACRASRAGYESAPFERVRANGKFEIRDYPALAVAETPMAEPGGDGSFLRLFRFISGANAEKKEIAMTTPVFMSGAGGNATMSFVLPKTLTAATAPKPSDGSVAVRELPPGRFAVMRFGGARSAGGEAAVLARLEEWMGREGLRPIPGPVFAYFDPPWTPPFLRRNEVMLRVGAEGRR